MGFLYSIILIKQRPDRAGQKLTTPQRFPDYRWAAAGHFIGFIFTILPSRYTLQHYRLTNSLSNKNTVWDVKFRFHLWDYQKGSLCWWFIRIKVQSRVKHLRDTGLQTHAETDYWFHIKQPTDSFKVCQSVGVVCLAAAGCCLVCQ